MSISLSRLVEPRPCLAWSGPPSCVGYDQGAYARCKMRANRPAIVHQQKSSGSCAGGHRTSGRAASSADALRRMGSLLDTDRLGVVQPSRASALAGALQPPAQRIGSAGVAAKRESAAAPVS